MVYMHFSVKMKYQPNNKFPILYNLILWLKDAVVIDMKMLDLLIYIYIS
jgi:hypothetical protein